MDMKVLWATKKGRPSWAEEIISTNELVFDKAKEWAKGQGFNRFRVSEFKDGERPDFTKVIN